MVFYFALPRAATFSGATQKGTLVKADYIRTDPSNLLYQLTSGYMYPLKSLLYNLMGNVATAIATSLSKETPTSVTFEKTPFFMPVMKLDECRHLTLPKVEISFSGKPNSKDLDDIERAGGEVIKIRGQVKDIYSIKVKDYDMLGVLAAFENVNADYRPTEGAMTVTQVNSLALIITRVHAIASFLGLVGSYTGGHFDFDLFTPSKEKPVVIEEGEEVPMDIACRNSRTVSPGPSTDVKGIQLQCKLRPLRSPVKCLLRL